MQYGNIVGQFKSDLCSGKIDLSAWGTWILWNISGARLMEQEVFVKLGILTV
jgi:hypothetical protein